MEEPSKQFRDRIEGQRAELADVIFKQAKNGDMQAAKLWTDWANGVLPPDPPPLPAPNGFAVMSSTELVELISSFEGDGG